VSPISHYVELPYYRDSLQPLLQSMQVCFCGRLANVSEGGSLGPPILYGVTPRRRSAASYPQAAVIPTNYSPCKIRRILKTERCASQQVVISGG
jgi:hypothetical protein